MHFLHRGLFVISLGVWLMVMGCDESRKDNAQSKVKPLTHRVVAVSYPLQYLTQRIVGDAIQVEMPVSPDADPRNWRPPRDSITNMQSADMIVANGTGASYANWLTTVSLPESKICLSATRGLALADYIAVEDVQVVHTHGPEGEHSHATMVARSWLDPAIAKQQAIYITEQLSRVYPDLADQFDGNLKSLSADLDQLSKLIEVIKQDEGPTVVSANPNLKFLTRASGANDRHLVWFELPDLKKAKSDLTNMLKEIPDPKPKLILFGSQQPGDDLVKELNSLGLTPVLIDLIDRKPDTGDYLTAMKSNIERFSASLKGE